MADTIKGRVNKKWTSTNKYRDAFDRIFGKKDIDIKEDTEINKEEQIEKENENE